MRGLLLAAVAMLTAPGVSPAQVLSETFSSPLSSDWITVDEGTTSRPSAWSASAGVLNQTSNIYTDDFSSGALPKEGTFLVYAPGSGLADVAYGWRQRSDDDDGIGFMFRYRDHNNYYRLSMDITRGYRRLVKKEAGVYTLLAFDTVAYTQGVWQTVRVEATGSRLQVFVDGLPAFDVTDSAHPTGSFAFYCWGNTGARFDDLVVTELAVEPDVTAPGTVTDLAVGATTSSSLTLIWTAPGDDLDQGRAAAYDLRMSGAPILNDADFNAAAPVAAVPFPGPAGQPEATTVTGLSPLATYHFALRTRDEVPNTSDLSNSASGTTTEPLPVAIGETFSTPLSGDWLVVDQGNTSAPSAWGVSGGLLNQTSNIYRDDGSNGALPKEGTYLLYTPGSSLTDVTYDWRQRSDDDDALGLMFRYRDINNYYRFSVDLQRGYRRLVKKVAGVYTLLAADTITYTQGVWQAVRVEAAGDRIQVFVDGLPVFDVTDPALADGSFAFYSWGNNGARFDDLSVAEMYVEPDLTEPGAVLDLAAGSPTSTSLALTWTAPGDDLDQGRAAAYDLRRAAAPIVSEVDFAAATPVAGVPAPQTAGAAESFVVSGLSANTGYHFALKTRDEAFNTSPLSNSAAGATLDVPPPPPAEIAFSNITSLAGVAGPATFGGHGVQFADITGDGLPDFYATMITNGTETLPDLFYRGSDGTLFVEEAASRGIDNLDLGSHSSVWADLDNDGDLDLYNGSWEQNRIYRNDGGGTFTDVTAGSGLPARSWRTRGVAAFDMDGDGDLDLFSVTGSQGSNDPVDERNEVYRNDGGLAFTAIDSGDLFTAPAGQGVTDVDFDGDGDVDLIAANPGGALNLLRHDGSGIFTLISPTALGLTSTVQNAVTAADVNNDGHVDLLLDRRLYLADGAGTFSFRQNLSGTGYMGGFADLDNDGDWDVVIAGAGTVLLNDGAGNFTPDATFTGCAADPLTCDSRSVAFADIDGDGDQDFFYANKQTYNTLIRNDYNGANGWLKVLPVRASGQPGAYGAKVAVYRAGQLGQDAGRIAWRQARSQEGYLAQNDPLLHFGLGLQALVDVRVTFPGGAVVDVPGVSAGQTLTVTEVIQAPDVTQPAAVTDLAASSATDTTLTLTWTAPGDDLDQGRAAAYDLRVSAAPILSDTDFTAATPVAGVPAPGPAGVSQSVVVGGLSPLTTYHFALKTRDEVPNTSALSNSASGTTIETPPVSLSETFSTPLSAEWTVVDQGTTSAPSAWGVSGGLLNQTSNIYKDDGSNAALPKEGTYLLYNPGGTLTDVTYDWRQRSDDDDALGLMFRYRDINNYYRFSVDFQRGYRRLVKKVAGVYTLLAADTITYTQGVWQTVRVEAAGSQLTVLVDGAPAFEVTDTAHSSGSFAFYSWGNNGARFDDLLVTELSVAPDLTAPGTVLDLAAGAATSSSLTLTWTAPGDDLNQGRAAAYDLRVAGAPIVDDAGFAAATPVPGLPLPQSAGAAESAMVTGLDPLTTYYFALKTRDEAFNFSAISNGASGATTEALPVSLSATFSGPLSSDWQIVDQGTISAPSAWGVSGGVLNQTSNIYKDDFSNAALPKEGTYLLYTPGTGFTDAAFDWRQRSDDDDALGLMFRYRDINNYYRFSVDLQRGYRRLVKKAAGVYTLLAADTITYTQGVWQTVRVEAAGTTIKIFVDGLLAFDVSDVAHSSGSFAFYSWGNTGARFDDLSVTELSAVPDTIAPAAVNDLTASAATSSTVTLAWTAPGDDLDQGRATAYDLRLAATPIVTDTDFDAATPVVGVPAPQTAGSAESFVVGGLAPETTYHFALKTRDEHANVSALSNDTFETTAPFSVYLETFDGPTPPGWSFDDDSGLVGGPGSWGTSGGRMVQSSDLKFLDLASGYPIGTYALWSAGSTLSDYTVRVRVQSPTGRSDDDRDIGVVLRYQDIDNFYRFSMDRARGRRLIARVGGDEFTLAADSSIYTLDADHDIEVLARGDRLLVRVDGDTILAAVDDRLSTGTAGLYATYNPGAAFDDFQVGDLPGEPALGLLAPVSFSVDAGNDLDVSALPLDDVEVPAVRFTLDPGPGQTVAIVNAPPFAASFTGLATGEHSVLAEVYDPAGPGPVSCLRCSDLRQTIGRGGRWIVGFGDSLMRGEQDDLAVDDYTADHRNDVIGSQPLLNNWLTSWTGLPHTVTGEAYEAFGVRDGLQVLPKALAKNPGAGTWLLLWGANDVSARKSGIGLDPNDPAYGSTFKDYMQRLLDELLGRGLEVIIGKLPYSTRPSANDVRIQEYNQVIDELYISNGLAGSAPDFYAMTAADPATTLSVDGLHLSGEGYRRMGRLWYEAVAERRAAAPDAPEAPLAAAQGGGLRIDWTAVAGADGYHVWRRNDPAGLFQRLTGLPVSGTTYLDGGLDSGVAYEYVVTAVAGGVEGPFSPEVIQTAP